MNKYIGIREFRDISLLVEEYKRYEDFLQQGFNSPRNLFYILDGEIEDLNKKFIEVLISINRTYSDEDKIPQAAVDEFKFHIYNHYRDKMEKIKDELLKYSIDVEKDDN